MKRASSWVIMLLITFLICPTQAQTPQPPLRFAIIGDYGSAGVAEANVAALVKSWNPAFIITLGDNNYPSGEQATIDANIGQYYHDYIGNYSGSYGAGSATNRFYPSMGNHDWYTTDAVPYLSYFTLPNNERYYTFTISDVQFFALDSDPNEPDGISNTSIQAHWLKTELANSPATWKIVYLHHAPYSSSAHGSNATLQWDFKAWGADAVLAGHDHTYERLTVNDMLYIVNGLGGQPSRYAFNDPPIAGSQVRYNASHGAVLVEADALHLTFNFITTDNEVIDNYTLIKPIVSLYLPFVSKSVGQLLFQLWAKQ